MPRDLFQQPPRDVLAARGVAPDNGPGFNAEAALDTVKALPTYGKDAGRSFLQGAGDLVVGAGQLASHVVPNFILNPLSSLVDRALGGTGEVGNPVDRYNNYMREREAEYQAGRTNNTPDVGRFTGSVVAGSLLGGGPAGATLPARMLQGAKLGGTLGLASPVNPDADSYVATKAMQTGTGAALGGAAPAVVEGAIRGAGAAVNALARGVGGIRNAIFGNTSSSHISDVLRAEFEKQGVNWDALHEGTKGSIVQEVQAALKSGGQLDPEAIRRLADFKGLDIPPTRGQLTRHPIEFAREQNLARTQVGEPIAQRLGEQNQSLINSLNQVRAQTGATAPDQYAAGQRVISDLRARDAASKAAVDQAYTAARSTAGMETDVPLQPVAQTAGQLVEDFGAENIPSPVMSRLKEFGLFDGKQTRVFNLREADKLRKLIGNNISAQGTPQAKALTILKGSVDDAVNSLGDTAGGETAAAFTQARGLAAQRFQTLERTPALQRAITDAGAPENFIEQQIIRGSVQDVANALRKMSPDARAEVRGAVVDWLKGKGVTGTEDAAKFSQGGLNRGLQTLGDRKLDLIFAGNRPLLEQLRRVGRVGAYIQAPPVASGVNYSASGTTLLDSLMRAQNLTRIPGIGPALGMVMGKPADAMMAAEASRAVRNAVPVSPAIPLLPPELVNSTAARVGMVAPPVSASTVPLFIGNPRDLLRR